MRVKHKREPRVLRFLDWVEDDWSRSWVVFLWATLATTLAVFVALIIQAIRLQGTSS